MGLVMWTPKVKWGSRVTPKRRVFLARGRGVLLRLSGVCVGLVSVGCEKCD